MMVSSSTTILWKIIIDICGYFYDGFLGTVIEIYEKNCHKTICKKIFIIKM